MITKESQTSRVLRLLKAKGSVSNVDLNKICYRYGARIHELREDGYIIITNRLPGGLYVFIYKGHIDDQTKDWAD
jgi:hypothetical protein